VLSRCAISRRTLFALLRHVFSQARRGIEGAARVLSVLASGQCWRAVTSECLFSVLSKFGKDFRAALAFVSKADMLAEKYARAWHSACCAPRGMLPTRSMHARMDRYTPPRDESAAMGSAIADAIAARRKSVQLHVDDADSTWLSSAEQSPLDDE